MIRTHAVVMAITMLPMLGCAGPGAVDVVDDPMTADFYIAPDGDDTQPGTADAPFATLARARDAVRRVLASGGARDLRVLIRGGVYRIADTVVFTLDDSAPDGGTVTYQAYPGETPVLSAGLPVTGWRKLDDAPDHLPAGARGKVWVAPLPDGVESCKTLFDGEARLPRARGEGFTPTGDAKTDSKDRRTLVYPDGALRDWPDLAGVEVVMIVGWPWTMNILSIERVDEARQTARAASPGTYELIKPRFGDFEHSAYIENTLAVLDAPGEWVVDAEARRLYLWPTGDAPSDTIVAPAVTELIRIEGGIDYDGPTDRPVRGLVFRGLTFTHGDRYTWELDRRGWGIQHDWEMFDRPTAMVRLRGAERCAIERCRFANAGSAGVRLDLHCQRNTIDGNVIEHLGGVGVLLVGYGPGTKDVNKLNRITRNRIHHIGELYWHSPAIFAWQSGENLIGNNLIHDTPYTGIVVSGRIGWDRRGNAECSRTMRWHEVDAVLGDAAKAMPPWELREQFLHARKNNIYRNDIHHVMQTLTDGNGIYISGCGTGNIARENFVHDCVSEHFAEGIRCDDDQYDAIVDRNVIWRLSGLASGITIKGRNHVTNNIIAAPIAAPGRGFLTLEFVPGQTPEGADIQRNIFYTTRPDDRVVFQGQCYYGTTIWLRDANTDHNLYFSTASADWATEHLANEQQHGSEMNSRQADPLFVDAEHGDFGLRPDSPALELGFEPIDMTKIGPGD